MGGLNGNIDHLNPIEVEVEVGVELGNIIIQKAVINRNLTVLDSHEGVPILLCLSTLLLLLLL